MTTLTIEIPDTEAQTIADFIKQRGGTIVGELTSAESASLKIAMKEAELIKGGKMQPLSFDDLWND